MDNESIKRVFYLLKILNERTDEKNVLSTREIMDILYNEYGIKSHRTTISSDIALLQEFDYDIEVIKSTQNKYYMAARAFDLTELKMLTDAVESSKFITQQKSRNIISKLSQFASEYQAENIKRNLYNEGKLKSNNEKILYIIDALNDAINSGKKISFYYFGYDQFKKKKMRNDGNPYIFSPYSLIWHGDNYYMVGYSEKHQSITNFRVDRIYKTPEILNTKAIPKPKGFKISSYISTMFSMYSSERQEVRLKCKNSTMDSIIDRFGEDTLITNCDNENFFANVTISVNHVFYSWIFGFGGNVSIDRPKEVKENYVKMLREVLEKEE